MRAAVVAKRLQGVHRNTSPHPELHPCHPRISGTSPRMTCVGLSVTSLGRGERAAPWILGTLATSARAGKSEDDMWGAVGGPKPASIHGPARAVLLAAEASGAEAGRCRWGMKSRASPGHTPAGGISFVGSLCRHTEDDGSRRDVLISSRLGDETAAILEPPLSTGAGGHSPDTSPGMVDRPSKRQRGARMRRSRSPWTARGRCDDLASILAGADATEQGALAPSPG